MDRLPRRYVAAVVFTVLVAAAAIGGVAVGTSASADRSLVVADGETGERLLEIPVDDGDEVTLSYIHSVEKTPVQDVYVVDGTTIRMDRMVFHSHGAGLPSDEPIERTDEGFVVYSNDTYDELGVVPAPIAGHELVVGDDRYDLVSLSDGWVAISLTERTVLDSILERDHRVTPAFG
ncbi:DUF1850 domain-containing protein [Natronorubrum sp. JWXQ-INN-674]|uniref:DUF1850 domain-containing protein n=1 Tax=Natronorubrum halalkaliphilum TaxID=2691917 RepID=A0A6B0VJD6_9EURY|nr:DUF1850 domain-containing protein [Natronorubrum halalkaliphilum]MXV60912.1 DUF1850 domain-containing protein [Natronorubrum halalkaliphilum]